MSVINVEIVESNNTDTIKSKLESRVPFIIRSCDIGNCSELWNFDYLCEKVGDVPVKIHVTQESNMDFVAKNFTYKTLPFNQLLKRVSKDIQEEYFDCPTELYYLRSISFDVRGLEVANLDKHFPTIAKDFKVPKIFNNDQFFSSVLRVSSKGVRLWTHYDIMDNVLVQVRGRKEVSLWPPNEVDNMYLIGDKSSVIDIGNPDCLKFPNFLKATKLKCTLEPGDILFIPALWFHNTLALTSGIAVNVFWKNLDQKAYDPKDTYGNKDLILGARALHALKTAKSNLSALPQEYRDFYIRRMIIELQNSLQSSSIRKDP